MSVEGMPHKPKPPNAMVAPSGIEATASSTLVQTLSITAPWLTSCRPGDAVRGGSGWRRCRPGRKQRQCSRGDEDRQHHHARRAGDGDGSVDLDERLLQFG